MSKRTTQSCFVNFKQEGVNAQFNRFTTVSEERGMKIVKTHV